MKRPWLVGVLRRGQERGEVAPAPLSSYTWAALQLGIWRESFDPATVLDDLESLTRRLLTPQAEDRRA